MNTLRTLVKKDGVLLIAVVALVWCGIGAGDWFMRIRWFRWQQGFFIRPSNVMSGPYAPLQTRTNAASRGGDLTLLTGLDAVVQRYGEEKPAWVFVSDEYGFPNHPPTLSNDYPIVIASDSYMVVGPGISNSFPGQLEKISGHRVFNHSYEGRGTFWGLMRFLVAERFMERKPRVLIWSAVERDIGGDSFAGVEAQLLSFGELTSNVVNQTRFNWYALQPASLRRSLPNTSAYSQAANKAWNNLRYRVFGRMSPYVIPSVEPRSQRPMLLYYPSIDALRWSEKQRFLLQVVRIVKRVQGILRERGIELVFVLIPDKEDVYRDLIPARYDQPDKPLRPSILPGLEHDLRTNGVEVVNLGPVFEEARQRGELVFWLDDTHWRPEGIQLATRVVWDRIKHLVEPATNGTSP